MDSTQPDSADASMRLAIQNFRQKMESSNRQFLQDRITEISALNLPTEQEKLEKMRTYWWDLTEKRDESWLASASPEAARQAIDEGSVARLSDVSSLYHLHMDGIIPSSTTPQWRTMLLDTLQKVCNEAAFRDEEDHDFVVPPCDDLVLFLKYASGIEEPDFRFEGLPSFHPPGSAYHASLSPEDLEDHLCRYVCSESFSDAYMHDDLEVRVGLNFGLGVKWKMSDHVEWYCLYLYCRRVVDEMDPDQSHRDWAWRVTISHAAVVENPQVVYGRKPRFDSIVEFLDWYGSWYEFLDLDQMRKDVALNCGEEVDCDEGEDED